MLPAIPLYLASVAMGPAARRALRAAGRPASGASCCRP